MVKEIGQLGYLVCAIRGMAVPRTYVKAAILGELAADSVKSPVGKVVARAVMGYSGGVAIAAIEGAVAFYGDGQKIVGKCQEQLDCWTKQPVWRHGR